MIANSLSDDVVTVSSFGEHFQQPCMVREFLDHERDDWDEFVRSPPNGHLMQGWSWGQYMLRLGWKPYRFGVLQDNRLVAAAQMFVIPSSLGATRAYVPRGPASLSIDNVVHPKLLTALHWHARQQGAFFLRIEPHEPAASPVGDLLEKHGFRPSRYTLRPHQPRTTVLVDLGCGRDAVFAGMKKQTRNRIRAASRQLSVRTASGEEDLARFHELLQEVSGRRGFDARPLSHLQALLEELGPRQEAQIFLAELDGQVIAGQMALAFGADGIALYGGWSSEHRNIPSNQLLDWTAIQWCIDRGCTRYDFWDAFEKPCIHPREDPCSPLSEDEIDPDALGIFRYKRSFGGTSLIFTGAYDYVYAPLKYRIWERMFDIQEKGTNLIGQFRDRVADAMDDAS